VVRGEIYLCDPASRSGSELKGPRPCVIVSNNLYASSPKWRVLTVVPFTSSGRWLEPSPTRVQFEAGECGLPKRCAAFVPQLTTLDKLKLKGPPLGRLSPEKEAELAEALGNYLGM
jgi:mRNA-degrading endonuclease toxin of MazEF toxin-antitoxin module